MENIRNSVILEAVLKAVYNVASRRTSSKLADEALGSTIKNLEIKFDFLKYVRINQVDFSNDAISISISPEVDSLRPELVGKAIEALIRVVYNDMSDEAGLYFVSELKEQAGEEVTKMIRDCEVDLDQVQFEQHYAYRRKERKKEISDATRIGRPTQNLIGYDWGNVSYWRHEAGSKYCTLFDKQGHVLDRLNLDRIIQNYVERLSGYIDVDPREIEKEVSLYEKEYALLKLLLERDMDADTAMHVLKISRQDLNNIIRKLSQMEMLQYVDYNTIELTNIGVGFLSKKDLKKNEK
jgi:hypothetical protein